ncbi:MAG: nitroreductase family deazaflavin-dependent oxidoreductase [Candidatus Bathyarchaeia archaeon]
MSVTDFTEAIEGKTEIEITVRGRRTKKARSTTVWFVYQGDKIYLLPVRGSDTSWYKNVLKDPDVTLTVDGRSLQARAEPITEPDRVQRVIELFAEKYGGMSEIKRWYSKLDVAIEIFPKPE